MSKLDRVRAFRRSPAFHIRLLKTMKTFTRKLLRAVPMIAGLMLLADASLPAAAKCEECDDCKLNIALKTNLVHDALLIPDLGIDMSLWNRFSFGVEGMYAWWSNVAKNQYWRIAGMWVETRYHFGKQAGKRAFTGHHVGIWGSASTFDFELGGKGYQSPSTTYGVGVSYGYSFPLNKSLSLELNLRVGYVDGDLIEYKPMCDDYYMTSNKRLKYFGVTDIGVTLVWNLSAGKN